MARNNQYRIHGIRLKTICSAWIIALIASPAVYFGHLNAEGDRLARRQIESIQLQAHASTIPAVLVDATPQTVKDIHRQIIYSYKHGDIIWRIYTLESSQGTAQGYNAWCQSKGQWNDFGFDVAHKVCFPTFASSVSAVNAWLDTHLKVMTLAQALCEYEDGKTYTACSHAKNFLNL